MLSELRITNLGVIADTTVELQPGLTVITGETGAGKTMVVSSLQLLSGTRADSSKIRHVPGADISEARVEGRFDTTGLPAEITEHTQQLLADCGAQPDDDGSVIALRTVRIDGRSRAHLGGRSVPATTLGQFSQPLLAIHGQHDQLRLLNSSQQRDALDRYDAETISPLRENYRALWKEWRAASRELHERHAQGRERARELAELTTAVAEIRDADVQDGEDYQLQQEIRRLMDADDLRADASLAHFLLSGDTQYLSTHDDAGQPGATSALDTIGQARDILSASSDSVLRDWAQRLDDALSIVDDTTAELRSYLANLDVDPVTLEEKLARQSQLKALIRKYGVDADDVLRWCAEAETRIVELDNSETSIDALRTRVEELTDATLEAARALSAARHKAARRLNKAVTTVLHTLAMEKATFTCDVSPLVENSTSVTARTVPLGEWGSDEVIFHLASSSGIAPQPLAKAASGGELSRVMLALEVVLAQDDYGRTLIFDEVDSGIGGSTALEIGRCLARLAHIHQVLVVTHLPQVAAFADHHFTVSKDTSADAAVTTVQQLEDGERVTELARMLAGMADTETGRAHASELWENARNLKNADRPA